jgi:hypothetical protein
MMGNQSTIAEYYTRGRHSNVNCIYITQNYFQLPRKSIRANANLLILFQLAKRDLENIYNDIVSCDIRTLKEFQSWSEKVWDKKYDFMVIDRYNESKNKRYRKGFDIFYNNVWTIK